MIAELKRAIDSYWKLNPLGRRLFREEVGLQGPPRRKRRAKAVPTTPAKPAKRTRRQVVDPLAQVTISEPQ